jgi:hypothetical protein
MAKRGETRPWKVSYVHENGIKGTSSFTSRDGAEMHAQMIQENADRRGMTTAITVTYREAK